MWGDLKLEHFLVFSGFPLLIKAVDFDAAVPFGQRLTDAFSPRYAPPERARLVSQQRKGAPADALKAHTSYDSAYSLRCAWLKRDAAVWCLGICFLQLLGSAPRLALETAEGLAELAQDTKLECIDFAAARAVSSRAEELLKRLSFRVRSLAASCVRCRNAVFRREQAMRHRRRAEPRVYQRRGRPNRDARANRARARSADAAADIDRSQGRARGWQSGLEQRQRSARWLAEWCLARLRCCSDRCCCACTTACGSQS